MDETCSQVVSCPDVALSLRRILMSGEYYKVFVLADENSSRHCLPLLGDVPAQVIRVAAGEAHKNVESLAAVWKALGDGGATRHSLLVNLGGGMVTDLGGFAAATFKRGMPFVNIPTSLLAMVDAAYGGKTGINFNGLKNEVGVFAMPLAVLVDARFLHTLPRKEFLSGYGEMLKHGLIDEPSHLHEVLQLDPWNPSDTLLQTVIGHSVMVKRRIVDADSHEQSTRKVLNLGHTVGHAFEALALSQGQPLPHGCAVAHGLVCELYLSFLKMGFPKHTLRQLMMVVKENFGVFHFTCKQYHELYQYMTHDKKNASDEVRCVLLEDVGKPLIDQSISRGDCEETFDFYRENMGG